MSPDYQKILLRTIGEFFTDLDIIVENDALATTKIGFSLFGSSMVSQIKSSIDVIFDDERTRLLFDNQKDEFFKLELEFFDKLDIKTWYPTLEKEEKEVIWRYLKSIKFLCGNIV